MTVKKKKMPNCKEFLEKKTIYGPKKEPVWVYLEREMKKNEHIKPYNEKVGSWLKFLKDLKWYQHCEARRKHKKLQKESGAIWYCELSLYQRKILDELPKDISCDLVFGRAVRTAKALADLGINAQFSMGLLMDAIIECDGDAGIFMWNIFTAHYKCPPSKPLPRYDFNAKLMMSSMFFIDLNQCIMQLNELVGPITSPPAPTKPKNRPQRPKYTYYLDSRIPPQEQRRNFGPKANSNPYKQRMYVARFRVRETRRRPLKPPPIKYPVKMRSPEVLEKLRMDRSFLERRKQQNKRSLLEETVCEYKFWKAPTAFRQETKKSKMFALKQDMLRTRAKIKERSNVMHNLGTVAYVDQPPRFVINNITNIPMTDYIPHNGGEVRLHTGEYMTKINNYCLDHKQRQPKCTDDCHCLQKWGQTVIDHLGNSKCKCGHRYDFKNEGKVKRKVFHSPTRHGEFWFDDAAIYRTDSVEDFIKDKVETALLSETPTPVLSYSLMSAMGLKISEFLKVLLADLSGTTLMIPHLAYAHEVIKLQEWCQQRLHGKYISKKKQRRLILRTRRRWQDMDHMDFRAHPYWIPFTEDQRHRMNWSHRNMIMKLARTLTNNFVARNQKKQLESARLFWSTMQYEKHPNKSFLQAFYTYMPSRLKDICAINPYSSERVSRKPPKPCRLRR